MLRRTFAFIAFAAGTALLVPGAAVSQQTAAQPPTYRVELVVFRATTALGRTENWMAPAAERGLESESSDATGGAEIARLIRLLGPGELQLRDVVSRLRSSSVYEPVAHVGWLQTASAWGTRAGFALGRVGIQVPGLSGNVFLERGQFLHLGMTLDYVMTLPPEGLGAGSGTVFSLDQSRRIRFYERNYYDHPAFGVIALVTPGQRTRPAGR